MNCLNCKARCVWAGKVKEPDHGNCYIGYVPKTNLDLVRSMDEKALASLMADGCPPGSDFHPGKTTADSGTEPPGRSATCAETRCCDFDSCFGCWFAWLREEMLT
jgi:hypothetical protein